MPNDPQALLLARLWHFQDAVLTQVDIVEAYILNQVFGHVVFMIGYIATSVTIGASEPPELTQAPAPVVDAIVVQIEQPGPPPPERVMIARAGE